MDEVEKAMIKGLRWIHHIVRENGHVPSIIHDNGRVENFTSGDYCPLSTSAVVSISHHIHLDPESLIEDLLSLRSTIPWPSGAYYSSTLRNNVMPNYSAHITQALQSQGHGTWRSVRFLMKMIDRYGIPPDALISPVPLRTNGRYPFWQAQIAVVLLTIHNDMGNDRILEAAERLYNAIQIREQRAGYPAEYFTDDAPSPRVHPAGIVAMAEIEMKLKKKTVHMDMAIDMLHSGLFHQYYTPDLKPLGREYDIMPSAHLGIILLQKGEISLAEEVLSALLKWQHSSGGFPGLPDPGEPSSPLYVWDTVWALRFLAEYRGGWPDV